MHIQMVDDFAALAAIACKNFRQIEQRHGLGEVERFVFLTECRAENRFEQARRKADQSTVSDDPCVLRKTGESNTLRVGGGETDSLVVVAGRQIVTAEAIEVLALGLNRLYPDGRPLATVIAELSQEEVLLILPWGVGKWLGRRGRIIADLVAGWGGRMLFLGDNGNRPFFWSLPSLFHTAAQAGIRNLPGSDPLPIPGQEEKIGSYGFYCQGSVDADVPFHSFFNLLHKPDVALTAYGTNEHLWNFCKHILLLRRGSKR